MGLLLILSGDDPACFFVPFSELVAGESTYPDWKEFCHAHYFSNLALFLCSLQQILRISPVMLIFFKYFSTKH